MTPRRHNLLVLAPVFALALWAMWFVTKTTSDTVKTQPDSAVYLATAAQLRDWQGPVVPFTFTWDQYAPGEALDFGDSVPSSHFPPLYPAALALVSVVTGGLRGAARFIDIACMGANLVLVGWFTARMTGFRSYIVTAIPPALLLFSADTRPFQFEGYGWVLIHQTIAAEPLFVTFFLGAIIAGGAAVRAVGWRQLVTAGVLAAAALATRYVGVALVAAIGAALLAFDADRAMRERVRRAALFGTIAVAPTFLFVAWSALLGGGNARVVDWHPVGGTRRTVEWFGRFLFPTGWPAWLRTTLLVVVVALLIAGAVKARFADDRAQATMRVALLSVAVYAATLVVTRTLLDRNVPIDPRLLAPARAVFYAAVVAMAYTVLAPKLRPVAAGVVIALAFIPVVASGWDDQQVWLDTVAIQPEPRTAVEEALADLPDDIFLVSTAPDVAYLKGGGHEAYMLPTRSVYLTGEPNPRYDAEIDEWAQILADRGGYVFFGPTLDPVVTPEELAAKVPLELVVEENGSALYEVVATPL